MPKRLIEILVLTGLFVTLILLSATSRASEVPEEKPPEECKSTVEPNAKKALPPKNPKSVENWDPAMRPPFGFGPWLYPKKEKE